MINNERKLPTVILSGASPFATDAELSTAWLKHELEQAGFIVKNVLGCYKGRQEPALTLCLFPGQALDAVLVYAEKYKQESVLFLNENRTAFFIDPISGNATKAGKWWSCTETEAKSHEGYTYDPETHTWYSIFE